MKKLFLPVFILLSVFSFGQALQGPGSGSGPVLFQNSPALQGTPTAPTATPSSTSTTQIATTAFVQSAITAGSVNFGNVLSGTNLHSLLIGTGGSLGVVGLGMNHATDTPIGGLLTGYGGSPVLLSGNTQNLVTYGNWFNGAAMVGTDGSGNAIACSILTGSQTCGYPGETVNSDNSINFSVPVFFNAQFGIGQTATAGSGGVTQYLLAAQDSSNPGLLVIPATSCPTGIAGIADSTAASSANFNLFSVPGVILSGIADNAVTAGDWLICGTSTAGRVRDSGQTLQSAISSGTQIVGQAETSATTGTSVSFRFAGPTTYGTQTASGTVTSVTFTGDGTVLSSTPSSAVTTSGTVTATLANAGAGTVLGNTTGSAAAPSYTTAPVLGLAGSTVGTLGFHNATSGTLTLSPPTGALGTVTVTVPAATDTLVNLAGTQTLTNKSIAGSEVNSGTVPVAQIPTAIPIGSVGSAGLSGTSPVTINSAGAIGCATCDTYGSNTQTANTVLAGPTSGAVADPTFRALVAADMPNINGTTVGQGGVWSNGVCDTCVGGYTGTNTPTNTTMYGNELTLQNPLTIGHLTTYISTGVASAIIYMCVYNSAGTTLEVGGSITAASSTTVESLSEAQVTLQPGHYLVTYEVAGGATAPTIQTFQQTGPTVFAQNANGKRFFTTANLGSAGSCPSTTGALTGSTTNGLWAILLEP